MFESIGPQEVTYIQKESPRTGDSFDFCNVYKTFIPAEIGGRRKYIIRAEKYEDVYALKFYASRDRKDSEKKYHVVHGDMGYRGFVSLLRTVLEVLRNLSLEDNECSFAIKAANTRDFRLRYEECDEENQRFKIYRSYLLATIGEETFAHMQYRNASAYLLVRRRKGVDSVLESARIMGMLLRKFE